MSPLQKFAWFNLSVIVISLVLVLSLMPLMGYASLGGLGCLGALGLGPFFFRKKPGQVLLDERDNLIQGRSLIVAYSLFWVVFVIAAVYLSVLLYGQEGAVPVPVVQMSVVWAFMFFYGAMSIGILIQYWRGGVHAEQ
jgi:hypothetical protein